MPPRVCVICADERQYIGAGGQRWMTQVELRSEGFRNEVRDVEASLVGVCTTPQFAIGQRALLIVTPGGNVLWDCISLVDPDSVQRLRSHGRVIGIAFSHPHFYASMVDWAHALDAEAIFVPEADRDWVTRPDPRIRYWRRAQELATGVTLIQCGGHFEGSAVVHWQGAAGGNGALLTGDTISVVRDRRWVTFMRSYPNQIPLPATTVDRIVASVRPYRFDRIYGGWWDSVVTSDAKSAIERSCDRYKRWISGIATP